MVRSFGLSHISLATQNLERSGNFYQNVFGMLIIERNEKSLVLQTPNTRDMLALELRVCEALFTQSYPQSGVLHFGFRLQTPEDLDEAIALALQFGGKLLKRGEFAKDSPFAYLADPEGYKIEVWYQP